MTSQAIQILKHEHRIIESVLGSLEGFVARTQEGEEVDRSVIRRYAAFFSQFADRCHHGKEEDLLFKTMTEHGFSDRTGPIAVMLGEHTEGRAHVRVLAELGSREGELSDEECDALAEHAGAYAPMLRNHIAKEDSILYPMAERTLQPSELSALVEAFERFERDEVGVEEHRRLRELAVLIVAEQPPYAPNPEDCGSCNACGMY